MKLKNNPYFNSLRISTDNGLSQLYLYIRSEYYVACRALIGSVLELEDSNGVGFYQPSYLVKSNILRFNTVKDITRIIQFFVDSSWIDQDSLEVILEKFNLKKSIKIPFGYLAKQKQKTSNEAIEINEKAKINMRDLELIAFSAAEFGDLNFLRVILGDPDVKEIARALHISQKEYEYFADEEFYSQLNVTFLTFQIEILDSYLKKGEHFNAEFLAGDLDNSYLDAKEAVIAQKLIDYRKSRVKFIINGKIASATEYEHWMRERADEFQKNKPCSMTLLNDINIVKLMELLNKKLIPAYSKLCDILNKRIEKEKVIGSMFLRRNAYMQNHHETLREFFSNKYFVLRLVRLYKLSKQEIIGMWRFLNKNHVSVNILNDDGKTLLDIASLHQREAIIHELIGRGVDTKNENKHDLAAHGLISTIPATSTNNMMQSLSIFPAVKINPIVSSDQKPTFYLKTH